MSGSISSASFGHVTNQEVPMSQTVLPPGSKLPAIVQGLQFVRHPVEYFDRCRERYGDPFTIRLPSTPPVILFSDPAAIREIFTGDDDVLHAGEATIMLQPILGANSLLLLDGPRHLHERRMMMPPFHGDRMRAYGETMRDVTERALASWPVGRPFPLLPETQAITLDVIMRTVFGLSDGAAMSTLRDRLQRFIAIAINPLYLWPVLQVDLGSLSPWGRFLRVRREIDRLLGDEIAARRASGDAGRADVLSLLLAARDEHGAPMADEQLRDELMTLLLAGHETTATALAWTMHRILTEEGVLDRVRDEIAGVAGTGRVASEDFARLEYLDGVIKETLRLHPVIPDVMRILKRPMRIGGIDLPAGVGATPNIHAAHRRPESWPEPLRFRPERFIGTRPSPYEYFPFGGGVRRCLGMAFALYEMKVVLATLFARADFAIAPGYGVRVVRRNVTWVPSEGMPVVLTRRAA
jgi:cytochrome P450